MIGKTVSHYKILEELGEGGMGIVYKSEDTKLRRLVALKFLSSKVIGTEEDRSRFIHEARAAAALSHPNICTVYEFEEAGGYSFLAMELIEGESLKAKIASSPLKLDESLDIAIQISRGLREAHEKGVVHRDIKPANVMFTSRGRAKIMDFGLAKTPGSIQLTKTGTTLGTAAYMSPEQARGEKVDHRTDIWSLGVVLYEMVAGRKPFPGDYEQAVVYSIINEEPEPVTARRTGIPLEFERIIGKAMAKNPDERYQHVSDLLVDLKSLRKGIERGPAIRRPSRAGSRKRNMILLPGAIAVSIAVIVLVISFMPERTGPIKSIAVLPLKNLADDAGLEYFTDGMTEALIADLAKIGALKVISRTSVMRFKDTEKPLPQIARELDVDAVIEGSVLHMGDRVRITAQLIEAGTDRHIWAESYERDVRDVIALQRDVARAVAKEIELKLTPQEEMILSSANAIDPGAHEAYLKGRYHLNKRTSEEVEKSIGYFERSIEIAPRFALAYAGLADVYLVMSSWGYLPPREMLPRAKSYALKALEMDDGLTEAYSALAAILRDYDYDWEESEALFKKILALNPNYATAHQWYAETLSFLGRHEEALAEIDRALELDPLSLVISYMRGEILYNARLYDEAIAQCLETLELESDFAAAQSILAGSYNSKGMYEEGMEQSKILLSMIGASDRQMAAYEKAFRDSGTAGTARWMIDEGIELSSQTYNKPFAYAGTYAALGDYEKSFEWLEKAYESGSFYIKGLGIYTGWDGMRADPRFQDMMRRIGLLDKLEQ